MDKIIKISNKKYNNQDTIIENKFMDWNTFLKILNNNRKEIINDFKNENENNSETNNDIKKYKELIDDFKIKNDKKNELKKLIIQHFMLHKEIKPVDVLNIHIDT